MDLVEIGTYFFLGRKKKKNEIIFPIDVTIFFLSWRLPAVWSLPAGVYIGTWRHSTAADVLDVSIRLGFVFLKLLLQLTIRRLSIKIRVSLFCGIPFQLSDIDVQDIFLCCKKKFETGGSDTCGRSRHLSAWLGVNNKQSGGRFLSLYLSFFGCC